jgi:hypothetical protein
MRETFHRNKFAGALLPARSIMYLIALTILLMALTFLSMLAPSLWQGFAILLVVILMALESHLPPPA